MAKVIKDSVTGLSKGYGFVKYGDIQMPSNAIANMNGYRPEGRTIALRVAGRPPKPVVPPGPPAPAMATYPVSSQPLGAHPSQQFAAGGPLGNAPPPSYGGTPVPWGPPVPPHYAPYEPPPPGSTMYPPVQGQPMPPYGVQYPPPVQPVPPGAPSQPPTSSEAQQSYPLGVQTENSTSAQSIPTNMYGNPMAAAPQPTYPTSSYGYPSYYSAVPPPPPPPTSVPGSTADQSQSIRNVPWATNPQVPPPGSSAEKTNYGVDAEYEKFMSEMK